MPENSEKLASVPPQNNMGGTKLLFDTSESGVVDWFTCTYRADLIPVEVMKIFFRKFCTRFVLKRARFTDGGKRNGFENRLSFFLKDEAASFAWGGNRGWAMLEFRGAACTHFDSKSYRLLMWFCRRYDARITRCDLAFDFYRGEVDVSALRTLYENDPSAVLKLAGKAPVLGHADQGSGLTVYLGKRDSSRQICVYEKGRQLAKQGFDKWVRVEVRYRRAGGDMEIPPDILNESLWWGYFSGLGPYFKALAPSAAEQKLRYNKRQLHAEINVLMRRQITYLRETFGPFFYFLSQIMDERFIVPMLADETRPWSQLKKFPAWETDEDFRELAFSSAMEMVPEWFRKNMMGFVFAEDKAHQGKVDDSAEDAPDF